jgi:hypothetical protein
VLLRAMAAPTAEMQLALAKQAACVFDLKFYVALTMEEAGWRWGLHMCFLTNLCCLLTGAPLEAGRCARRA